MIKIPFSFLQILNDLMTNDLMTNDLMTVPHCII